MEGISLLIPRDIGNVLSYSSNGTCYRQHHPRLSACRRMQ